MQTTKTLSAFRKTAETLAAGAKTLPRESFVSPEVFAAEQKRIFSKQWLLVGHQSQLTNVGDYFVTVAAGPPSISAPSSAEAGESLIVVRDKGSELRAFYNVCRHRGTRLCEETHGHLSAIQCPYHAWTYGLDGRLLGAPHMDEVPGFAKADYSLHAADLALWEGFIFVHLAGSPTSLEEWFAPLAGKFSHWNLPNLRSVKQIRYDVRANWKLIFENYSECYHCPGVHPTLSKLTPYDSAENDLCEGPFLGGFMPIMNGKSLTMSGNACALPVGGIKADHDHQLEHEHEHGERVFYYSIFPSMLLSLHPGYAMVHQILPQSAEHTVILCDWFFHPDAAAANGLGYRFNPEDAIEFWDMTNKQDWHVCELSQQGIASRAYEPGPYSPRESIPAAWDEYYLRFMK